MTEAIDYVKTDLMPDFDFDAFNHENSENYEGNNYSEKKEHEVTPEAHNENNPTATQSETEPSSDKEESVSEKPDEHSNPTQHEEVDKW